MKKLYHSDGIYVLKKEYDKLKRDLKFSLGVAEQLFSKDSPPQRLSPEFYHTLSYEEDLKIYNKLKEIREKLE